jgi:hypothetical protein
MRVIMMLLLVAALVAGCKKDSNTVGPGGGTNTGSVIYPLSVGNQWVYRTTRMDSTGAILEQYTDTTLILRDTTIAGTTWYISTGNLMQLNKADGLWFRVDGGMGLMEFLFLKYPASAGDSYEITFGQLSLGAMSVQSTGVSVDVPAGTYTCHLYRLPSPMPPSGGSASYIEFSACPGVGLIKNESFVKTTGGITYSDSRGELVSVVLH